MLDKDFSVRGACIVHRVPNTINMNLNFEEMEDFDERNEKDILFLKYLQDFIERRRQEMPEGSYTTSLFSKGVARMAQKVGEEAVETVIEAMSGNDDPL